MYMYYCYTHTEFGLQWSAHTHWTVCWPFFTIRAATVYWAESLDAPFPFVFQASSWTEIICFLSSMVIWASTSSPGFCTHHENTYFNPLAHICVITLQMLQSVTTPYNISFRGNYWWATASKHQSQPMSMSFLACIIYPAPQMVEKKPSPALPEHGAQCTDTSGPEKQEEKMWRRRQVPGEVDKTVKEKDEMRSMHMLSTEQWFLCNINVHLFEASLFCHLTEPD